MGKLLPQPGENRNGVRTYLRVRMPTFNFSPNELRTLVRFFLAVSAQQEPYIKPQLEPLSAQEKDLARALFTSQAAPCLKCHMTGDAGQDQTKTAPNFLVAGGRLKGGGTTGTVEEVLIDAGHPAVKGLKPIKGTDEPLAPDAPNEADRTVLSVRAEGDAKVPVTWVRAHEKGRVFHTAWGHDERTWGNEDFQNLLGRGVRWAAGDWALRTGVAMGLAMIAAGAASAQGRTSLRKTGYFVGMFIPVLAAAVFG
jgi:hypothetical protein